MAPRRRAALLHLHELGISKVLGVRDEELSAAARRRLEQAPELGAVDLDGFVGVKPQARVKRHFESRRIPVLLRQSLRAMPRALMHATLHPRRLAFDDSDVAYLFNHTYFGRLVRRHAVDLRHHASLETLPGFYTHGIEAKLRPGFELDRIVIDGETVVPSDRGWPLAKIHLLAAMDNEALFADHAVGHLANNFLEAIVKRTVPPRHPLHLFLAAHFGFGIALDEFIMELLHRHSSPGNPLALTMQAVYAIIRKGFADDHERGAAPTFHDTPFDEAMSRAWQLVREHVADFVRRNLSEASLGELRPMFDEAHERFPYYPAGTSATLADVEVLAARFVYEASFLSSVDHVVTRDDLGFFRSVFRVRQPFRKDARADMGRLFRPIDTYQRVLFRSVFSGEDCERPLRDVSYDASLAVDTARFKRGLSMLERQHPRLFPGDRISAFIDI